MASDQQMKKTVYNSVLLTASIDPATGDGDINGIPVKLPQLPESDLGGMTEAMKSALDQKLIDSLK